LHTAGVPLGPNAYRSAAPETVPTAEVASR